MHFWRARIRVRLPFVFWKPAWHLPMNKAVAVQEFPATDFEDNESPAPTDAYWSRLPICRRAIHRTFRRAVHHFVVRFRPRYNAGGFVSFPAATGFAAGTGPSVCNHQPAYARSFRAERIGNALVGDLDVGDARFDCRESYSTWFTAWLKEDREALRIVGGWPKLRHFAMGRNRWQESSQWTLASMCEQVFSSGAAVGPIRCVGMACCAHR
jgi:hypothetical protein